MLAAPFFSLALRLTEGLSRSFVRKLGKPRKIFLFFFFFLSADVLTIQSSLCTHAHTRTAFGFLFSDKCGFSTERLLLNKRRDAVENVAGMAFLLAADRVQTGSYIGLDYIIGDTGISQGRYVGKKKTGVLFSLIMQVVPGAVARACSLT